MSHKLYRRCWLVRSASFYGGNEVPGYSFLYVGSVTACDADCSILKLCYECLVSSIFLNTPIAVVPQLDSYRDLSDFSFTTKVFT